MTTPLETHLLEHIQQAEDRVKDDWSAGFCAGLKDAFNAVAAQAPKAEPPAEVLAALDRMCAPLHESRLSGVTAEMDAKCMALIRDYVEALRLQVRQADERGDEAMRRAHAAEAAAEAAAGDTERMDWMERNLCRAGEVRDDQGRCIKLARVWSIMGELETLRDTVDAARAAS